MAEKFWRVTAVVNDDTKAWWAAAKQAYNEYPLSVPDSVYPLLDENWGEKEIIATRNEIRDIQAWAIGLPGWIAHKPALEVSK